METTGTPTESAKDKRKHWLSIFRPLIIWCILVLLLFGLHTHQRLLERTRLVFSVSFQGQGLTWTTAKLDNREVGSGDRIALGRHSLDVMLPKAEPFQTNLFVWYGTNDLGTLVLNRARGGLDLKVEPKAQWVAIQGPEYRQTFTNCTELNVTLPTDTYSIQAHYANWQKEDQVTIFDRQTNAWRIASRLGALALTCNQADAAFELIGPDNRTVQTSPLPITILDLPEGKYMVLTRHHRFQWEKQAVVKAGVTNEIPVQLDYGKLIIKAAPDVVSVKSSDGRDWGSTPLTVNEIPVGLWNFTLETYGYEPATLAVEIKSNETVKMFTNLVSRNYTAAISSAKQYFENGDYERAAQAAQNALLAKRDDPEASKLHREASGLLSLRQAKDLGGRGDYISALKELKSAANALPDNTEVVQLLTKFKTPAIEQREWLKVQRLNQGKVEMENLVSRLPDAELFETHELKSTRPVREVEKAIIEALQRNPAFKIARHEAMGRETFFIDARQELQTYLQTSAGRRQCLIVLSQVTDEETEILFKVLEYKAEAVEKLSIGALIGAPVDVKYVPIHESHISKITDSLRAQVAEGVSNVTVRVQMILLDGQR
jgi:tetratricopeptide (TPR) repeat protein